MDPVLVLPFLIGIITLGVFTWHWRKSPKEAEPSVTDCKDVKRSTTDLTQKISLRGKRQKELEHFITLLLTVQGPCNWCLEKILLKNLHDLGKSLDSFLKSKKREILLSRIGQQRKTEFFPPNGTGADLQKWDVQMYWLMLTKTLQQTPTQTQDIGNVKDIRNKLCHLSNPQLNEGDFNLYNRQITTFIDETVKLIADGAFEQKIKCGLKEISTLLQMTVFDIVNTVHRFYQGHTTVLEEIHAIVNHISANEIPEMKKMYLEVKELFSIHFPSDHLKQIKAPEESSVTMTMQNVSVNEEEELSIVLVNLFMEEINHSKRGDDPVQNDLSRALQRALTKFKQYGTLTKILRGSVVFYIQFNSFLSFINCYDDVLAGKLTTEFKPLEIELQNIIQRPSLELDVIINTNEVQHFLHHSLQLLKQSGAGLDVDKEPTSDKVQLLKQSGAGLDVDKEPTSDKEVDMMSSELSMEQMPETPVLEESREPDNRQSKQSKNMPRVHTASSLVLQSEEPKKLRNDSGAQRYWSPHDLEVFKKPLCLISAGPRNELKLEVDTIEQLSKIDLPCVVVAIAGLYRTGKSFLMNRLADQNRGFALGDSIKSTTKGIWVWCRVHPEQKNTVLVLLDTEGLGDIAEGDPTHDNTLFTLATLLSSTLVYNMKGAFDQDAVNKLTFVTELSKNIALENRFDDALQCILPGFVLVVRDFTLKLVKGDRKITADEYLEESLQDVDYGKSSKNEKFNRARASIRNYFPESRRKCFLLPPPGDLDITENLEMLRFEDLSRRFQEQTTCFVSYINAQPPKKLVVSKPVTGSMFAELTRTYVEAIRNGGVPDVEDAFAAVAKSENEKVKKETLDKFEVFMSKCTVPAPIKQLEPQYREAELASLVHFRTNAVFDDGNIVEKEVQMNMDIFWASMKDNNLRSIREKCKAALETSNWVVEFKTQLENRTFEVAGGYSKYRQRLQIVEIEFKSSFSGYDEHEYMGAWSEFLQSIKSKEAFIMSKDESLSEEESLEEKQKQEEKLQAMANRMKEDAANALRNQQDSFRNQQEVINKERERERVAREAELRRFMEDRNVVLEKLLSKQQSQIEALINRPPTVVRERSDSCVVQ